MHKYELYQVYRASDIQEIIASAQGVVTELDGMPNDSQRPVVDALLEEIGDIWELAEDFNDSSNWAKSLDRIDDSLNAMNLVGWRLYAAFIAKDALNPFTGKQETIKVMLAVASEQNAEKLNFSPKTDTI